MPRNPSMSGRNAPRELRAEITSLFIERARTSSAAETCGTPFSNLRERRHCPLVTAKCQLLLKNLRLLLQVRRRRVAAWMRLCPAGALAMGGFGRSRWRGGRGGVMGFACAIRDL